MPYLSRIRMNPLRRRAQLFLRNPHTLHAAVLGGVPQQPVTERVLWRLDAAVIPTTHAVPRGHQAELLVLTESRPSWEHIIEQAGWVDVDDPQFEIRDYQPLLEKIQRGREFRLRVRANPVSATKRPLKPSAAQEKRLAGERPRGVRVAQRTAAQQLEWSCRRRRDAVSRYRIRRWSSSSRVIALPSARPVETSLTESCSPPRLSTASCGSATSTSRVATSWGGSGQRKGMAAV